MHPAKDEGLPAPCKKNQNSVGTRVAYFLSRTSPHLRCLLHKCFPRGERSTPLLHTVNTEGPQKTIVRSAACCNCCSVVPAHTSQPKQF
ncbi:hypothetical protein CEXT_337381 [Caerostris extrusa]|uniref:Uncharacterized protein n=1 Tax=Caerostris extrusa TaxID=172846 RepID=A0AAV4SS43_CAEEX|nr:hypothetical protein CEXT_337381 [Caerostris extrusa]